MSGKKLDYLAVYLDVVLKHCEQNRPVTAKDYKYRCIRCPFVPFCTLLGTSDINRSFSDINELYNFLLSSVQSSQIKIYLGSCETVTIDIKQ